MRKCTKYVTVYKMAMTMKYICRPGFQGPRCNNGKNHIKHHLSRSLETQQAMQWQTVK